MQIVNTHDAKTYLSRLLAQVAAGQEVVIGNAGKPVAKLVPYKSVPKKRIPGRLKGKIWISPDFTDEDPEINAMFYGKD